MPYQNLWDAMKIVLNGKLIAANIYIKKTNFEINNVTWYIKELEKEQTKHTSLAEERK